MCSEAQGPTVQIPLRLCTQPTAGSKFLARTADSLGNQCFKAPAHNVPPLELRNPDTKGWTKDLQEVTSKEPNPPLKARSDR